MTEQLIIRAVTAAMAIILERIQQGNYSPPTEDELQAALSKLEGMADLPEKKKAGATTKH